MLLAVMVQGFLRTLQRPFSPQPVPVSEENLGDTPPVSLSAPVNFLVLGADQRPGDPGRSDSILLVSFDATAKDHPVVRMMSIQRDTWAEIPGHGNDKINHAFAFGGADLSRKTVEHLINLPVDHTVVVNMAGFEQVIDQLGGVDVNVDEDMDYDDPYDTPPLHIHLKKGPQHMNGRQALEYSRFRHDDQGDFGRMRRQQQVLKAMASEATKPENLLRIPGLLKAVQQAINTDLTYGDLLQMALAARKVKPEAITSQFEGGRDRWIDGVYYLEPDLVALRAAAYRTFTGKEPGSAFLQQAQGEEVAYAASFGSSPAVTALAPLAPLAPLALHSPPQGSPEQGNSPAPQGDSKPDAAKGALSIGLRDATGADLLQLYEPYVAQAGYRVVQLGSTIPLNQTTIVLHSDNPKLGQALQALFVHARVVVASDPNAETPAEIWLGKDLPERP